MWQVSVPWELATATCVLETADEGNSRDAPESLARQKGFSPPYPFYRASTDDDDDDDKRHHYDSVNCCHMAHLSSLRSRQVG